MDDRLQSDDCAKVLHALAAPERLRIIQYLTEGPRNVTEIAAMLGTPMVNVSHHMSVLRQAHLVENRRQGRFIIYSLIPGLLESGLPGQTERLNLGCCRLELPPETEPPSPRDS
jgi:DNA-binding transcriptional ArsR family regulator